MPELSGQVLWLALAAVCAAALVHGTFGLGFPLVATPLLALVTDVRSAVLLSLLPTIAVNLAMLLRGSYLGAGLGPHWRTLPYVLLGAVCGSTLLLILDPRPFLLVLAGALLLYLNQHRLGERFDLAWVHRKPGLAYAVFGLSAGAMAGMVNVMVPVLIILAMELRLPSHSTVQLLNMNFLAAKLTQVAMFALAGALSPQVLANSLPLLAAALLALAIGMQIRRRISEENYRGLLRAVLWVMVAVLVSRYLQLG
jgi:uncharacterized membrane protein YfcA